MLPRTAVFIDGDWLRFACVEIKASVDFAKFFNALKDHFGLTTDVHLYMSSKGDEGEANEFPETLKRIGYSVKTFLLQRRGEGPWVSKGLDVSLAVDAAALTSEYDRLVLVSGDNDFEPLMRKAREVGRSTILVAVPLMAGARLARAAQHFVALEDLISYAPNLANSTDDAKSMQQEPSQLYIKKGEHFGPYLLLRRLFMEAEQEVTVIDAYLDEQILYMVKLVKPNVVTHIFTDRVNSVDFSNLLLKIRREGREVQVYKTKEFHDRYLRIDTDWWHSGHSFKDLGTKDSLITKVTDTAIIDKLKNRESELLAIAQKVYG